MLRATAYGIDWYGSDFDSLVRQIDAHGEKYNLRAVSIVAVEI